MTLTIKSKLNICDAKSTRGCALARNASGEIICMFIDSIYGGPGGRLMTVCSSDEAQSWSEPTLVTTSTHGAEGSIVFWQGLAALRDGKLVALFNDLIGKPSGDAQTQLIVAVSSDGGNKWDFTSAESEWAEFIHFGKIIETADGVLLAPVWGTRLKGEPRRVGLLVSGDGGATWNIRSTIANDRFGMIPGNGFVETSIAEISNDRLLAVISQTKLTGCEGKDLFYSVSDDMGDIWSRYEPLPICGQLPSLLKRADGTLLLACQTTPDERFGQAHSGIAVRESADDGATWSEELPLELPGNPGKGESDASYPAMLALKDGSVMVAFSARGARADEKEDDSAKGGGYYIAANILAEK